MEAKLNDALQQLEDLRSSIDVISARIDRLDRREEAQASSAPRATPPMQEQSTQGMAAFLPRQPSLLPPNKNPFAVAPPPLPSNAAASAALSTFGSPSLPFIASTAPPRPVSHTQRALTPQQLRPHCRRSGLLGEECLGVGSPPAVLGPKKPVDGRAQVEDGRAPDEA